MPYPLVSTGIDWGAMWGMSLGPLEVFLRGSIMYLGIFILLRVVLKREASSLGLTDLLVLVMIADAAQNAMAGSYTSIPDGMLLVATLLFWAWFLDYLYFNIPALRRWIRPGPLLLVKGGRIQAENCRRELITREDLMEMLRTNGVDDLQQVKRAWLEGNGAFSVIRYDSE